MGVRSAITVDAATVAQDQPRPSRNSPAKICHDVPCGDSPHSASDDQQDHSPGDQDGRPAEAVGGPADQRGEGEHAEHVDEMTNPMTSRCAPPCSMWSGVMIITVTIAAWAQAIATTAAPTAGTSRTTATKRPHDRPRGSGPALGTTPAVSWARSSGSGRSRHDDPPGRDDQDDGADGEAHRSARARPWNVRPAAPTPVRLGPATAPTVVAHTTTDRARARCSSVARSVAA